MHGVLVMGEASEAVVFPDACGEDLVENFRDWARGGHNSARSMRC